ncbi:hypothetical protein J6590_050305 [Homalodisca vitripennis]|nr:hypothetical protein J6590_050305 [Homalodisca vitripennis]
MFTASQQLEENISSLLSDLVKKTSASTGTPSRRGFKTRLTTSDPLQACRVGT